MTKPAARIGDDTVHGGKIVEGDTSVLIGGKPAARIGDDHTCPRTGHRGGPDLPPSAPQTLIGGKPAARVGDKMQCRGEDTIGSGDTTVLIGEGAAAAPPPSGAPEEDWVDLHYTYADGTGVPRAKYFVEKGGVVVAQGTLDDEGKAHVTLPAGTDKVSYYFDDDPEEFIVYPEYRTRPNPYQNSRGAKEPVEDERSTWEKVGGWIWGKTKDAVEAAGEALESSGEWVWGVIKGDFNEDPSMGQIVVRGVISFVPIVGQAMDIQDIVAGVYQLVWYKRYTEVRIWIALVITLLGCIPWIGDAGKIAFKLLRKTTGKSRVLAKLLKALNAMGKGNAVQWLKKLSAKLPGYGKEAAATFKQILDDLSARLTKIGSYRLMRRVKAEIDELLATIQTVRSKVDEMFDKIVKELKQKLDDALAKAKRVKGEGPTRTELTLTQDAELANARTLGKADDAGEAATINKYKNKTVDLPNGKKGLGPGASLEGRGVNLTDDRGMTVRETGSAFHVGAHSTKDSLSFFSDYDATKPLSTRQVAVKMYKNGYDGGDVVLSACESGQNMGLTKGLRRELDKLPLSKPVGTIAAPTEAVLGTGAVKDGGSWKRFK